MADLCWVVVTLTLFLSGENSVAATDKKQLADIVKFIMNRYNIKTQVSVAVNIPMKTTQKYLQEVFQKATAAAVKKKLNQASVYPDVEEDASVEVARLEKGLNKEEEPKVEEGARSEDVVSLKGGKEVKEGAGVEDAANVEEVADVEKEAGVEAGDCNDSAQ
ncbi:uncharacterized protein AKAME5_001947400, partial [Lates japonicus]